MKTIKSFICGCIFTSIIFVGTFAAAESKMISVAYDNIKIKINGENVSTDVSPFIYQGRTFVPIRFVAEKLDKDVKWDGINRTVEIKDQYKNFEELDNMKVYINNKEITLDTKPLKYYSSIYLEANEYSKIYNGKWDNEKQTLECEYNNVKVSINKMRIYRTINNKTIEMSNVTGFVNHNNKIYIHIQSVVEAFEHSYKNTNENRIDINQM